MFIRDDSMATSFGEACLPRMWSFTQPNLGTFPKMAVLQQWLYQDQKYSIWLSLSWPNHWWKELSGLQGSAIWQVCCSLNDLVIEDSDSFNWWVRNSLFKDPLLSLQSPSSGRVIKIKVNKNSRECLERYPLALALARNIFHWCVQAKWEFYQDFNLSETG